MRGQTSRRNGSEGNAFETAAGSVIRTPTIAADRLRSLQPAFAAVDRRQLRVRRDSAATPSNTTLAAATCRRCDRRSALRSSTSCMLTTHRDRARSRPIVGEQLHDLDRGLRVERGSRLVGEQQPRAAASPRARCRRAGAGRRKASRRGCARNHARPTTSSNSKARADVLRRKLASPRAPRRHVAQSVRRADVLHHREALDQVELLEHHADVAARLSQRLVARAERDPASSNSIAPGVGSTRRLMQRISVALARPRRADDRGDPARRDLERRCRCRHRTVPAT